MENHQGKLASNLAADGVHAPSRSPGKSDESTAAALRSEMERSPRFKQSLDRIADHAAPKLREKDDKSGLEAAETNLVWQVRASEAFGSANFEFVSTQVGFLAQIGNSSVTATNALLGFCHDLNPNDPIEGALGAQMAATHHLAMTCMQRASCSNDMDYVETKLNQANKLMRTYTAQMEALNRHRGKGQQKMTVEHVHVNEGGQAIIGTVDAATVARGARNE